MQDIPIGRTQNVECRIEDIDDRGLLISSDETERCTVTERFYAILNGRLSETDGGKRTWKRRSEEPRFLTIIVKDPLGMRLIAFSVLPGSALSRPWDVAPKLDEFPVRSILTRAARAERGGRVDRPQPAARGDGGIKIDSGTQEHGPRDARVEAGEQFR